MSTETEAFASRLQSFYAGAAMTLSISMGHQLGLFEALATFDDPATSAEIAAKANLNERYVREWLNGIAMADIIHIQQGDQLRYMLPKSHAAVLTGSVANMAPMASIIPLVTPVFEDIKTCFRKGGGVPYCKYHGFHELMGEFARRQQDELVPKFVPSVQGLHERLTSGIAVADVGCGIGVAIRTLAKAYPNSTFLGIDLAKEAIDMGSKLAEEAGVAGNCSFLALDAAEIHTRADLQGRFDYVTTFDAIHDQARPDVVLLGIRKMLRAGGLYSLVDIHAHTNPLDNRSDPFAPLFYTGTMWGIEKAQAMLRDAGFTEQQILGKDGFNVHILCRV